MTDDPYNAMLDQVGRVKAADLKPFPVTRGLASGVKTLYDKAKFPLIPLAVAGAFALPWLARREEGSSDIGQKFTDAQSRGETPMSDSFNSFVQHRKHGQAKEANLKPPAIAASTAGDALKSLLMKTKRTGGIPVRQNMVNGDLKGLVPDLTPTTPYHAYGPQQGARISEDATGALKAYNKGKGDFVDLGAGQLVHEHDVLDWGKVGLGAGLAGGAGISYNALTTSADNPLQYKIQKAIYGPEDRGQLRDEFNKGLAHQGGKETAGVLRELLEGATGQAMESAQSVPRRVQQSNVFQQALSGDEMLQSAGPEDQELLGRAYRTMQKFAPELASDEFAVKNYLRESLMAANGPDYATISNLARANRDITDTGRK